MMTQVPVTHFGTPCECDPCPVHGLHCQHVTNTNARPDIHDYIGQPQVVPNAANFYRVQNGKIVVVPKEEDLRSDMVIEKSRGCSSWFRGLFITMWVIIGVVVLAMVTGLILWALMA